MVHRLLLDMGWENLIIEIVSILGISYIPKTKQDIYIDLEKGEREHNPICFFLAL